VSTYEVGQTLTFGVTVTDANGAAANVGTGPVGVVTLPDGVTTASAVVTNPQTGSYVGTHAATQPGRYRITWTASGTNSGGFPYTDLADVWPADPRLIISLAAARDALNVPDSDRADDDELRLYIAATTEVIESLTGPLLAATRVETYDGDGSAVLALHAYPNAITSVVENGATLPATAYAIGRGGILWRRTGVWSGSYPGNIVVTYTVGRTSIPPNVALAAREQLRHLWQVGQVATRPGLGGEPAPGYATPMGFAVPNRVIELLGNHLHRHHGGGVY
jgi:hypothetical protein